MIECILGEGGVTAPPTGVTHKTRGFQASGRGSYNRGNIECNMGEGFQLSGWGSYNRGNIECNMGEGFQHALLAGIPELRN